MMKVRVVALYWMCGISREPYSERFDGYESAYRPTTFVATFPRVIGDELTVF